MRSGLVVLGPALGVAVVLLVGVAVVLARLGGLGHGRAVLTASARAAVQLGAVSLVITAVVASGALTAAFVAAMATVAAATSARRVTPSRTGVWVGLAVVPGPVLIVLALLAGGVVPLTGLAVVPMAGILIGGAMTATTLAGRRALDELTARRGEYEAALSVGLLQRDAALLVCRDAAADALVPALDQTRTVGLVTLPGAFVGMLLGGAGPLAAGVVQLVVLVGLLAVESLAVLVVVELVARGVVVREVSITRGRARSAPRRRRRRTRPRPRAG
ncbi:MAG: ABC transporter permease [Mycobacteriaceae bacterium]